jgi:hypothetical protein
MPSLLTGNEPRFVACVGKDKAKFALNDEQPIADPTRILSDLCEFLRLEAPSDYLWDYASVIHQKPHVTTSNGRPRRFQMAGKRRKISMARGL